MGVYGEYLEAGFSFEALTAERKKQLSEISKRRGRDVLVFAADLNKGNAPNSIDYGDLLPISDQIENLRGTKLDLILESPGGSGEVAEDIIRLLRNRFSEIAVIVPGYAKSAATIMAMAADEILMGPASSLGPIDAQMGWQGKVFSAHALLEGFRKIKEEVEQTGQLNKAYIPILQGSLQASFRRRRTRSILPESWSSSGWRSTSSKTGTFIPAPARPLRMRTGKSGRKKSLIGCAITGSGSRMDGRQRSRISKR